MCFVFGNSRLLLSKALSSNLRHRPLQLIPGDWELIIIVAQMPRNYQAIHKIAWNVARLHVFVKDILFLSFIDSIFRFSKK